ncbi:MAG: hypothetical protein EAZ28_01525 [Oscillatoriales cyanobacterium]|nr:MAG: hypothetical protein EAZ28_01525 [Oscillatoriales cyanobacterium]
MSKLVILEIGDVDSEQRYPVALRIGDSIHSAMAESRGRLPPAKDFLKAYEDLRLERTVRGFGCYRKLEHKKGQITKSSVQELAVQVKARINTWLNSGDSLFQSVRDKLLQVLSAEKGNVRLMIQTDDIYFWGLPWHLWDKLDELKIEPSFSRLTNTLGNYQPTNSKNKVRILVVLGGHTDINLQADLEYWKSLIERDAEIEAVTIPIIWLLLRQYNCMAGILFLRKSLIAIRSTQLNEQLWKRNWDILFFAGHSSSNSDYSLLSVKLKA